MSDVTIGQVLCDKRTEIVGMAFHGKISRAGRNAPSRAHVVIPETWISDIFKRILGQDPEYDYFLVRSHKAAAKKPEPSVPRRKGGKR